jgi:ElaB/YqjD/DUF883 family membrane-anchored ribosome-binding protein
MKQESNHESHGAAAAAHMAGNGSPGMGGESADGAQSAIAREYQAFISDVEHLVASATSMTGEDLARAKAKLSARISSARAGVGSVGRSAVDRARVGAKAADQYVRNQPWQAVGISAVAGLLIGLLLARRNS